MFTFFNYVLYISLGNSARNEGRGLRKETDPLNYFLFIFMLVTILFHYYEQTVQIVRLDDSNKFKKRYLKIP